MRGVRKRDMMTIQRQNPTGCMHTRSREKEEEKEKKVLIKLYNTFIN